MLKRAVITLDLPESDGLTNVRVALSDEDGEVTVYQSRVPSNASRHPEVELVYEVAGEFTCKVYVNDVFKYSMPVRFE